MVTLQIVCVQIAGELKTHRMEKPSDVSFSKLPPAPVPGFFYIEMTPKIDIEQHCPSMDHLYKSIHTPITEMFPIDILEEMRTMEEGRGESWLRQGAHIDSTYYQEKSDRNELLMRDELKHNIEDVMDYQEYLRDTFATINEDLDGYEVEEEYPLFPSNEQLILVTGLFQGEDASGFVHETSETSLVDKCVVGGKTYNSTKLHVEDKICIEIRDGKAFYSPIMYIYKFGNIEP